MATPAGPRRTGGARRHGGPVVVLGIDPGSQATGYGLIDCARRDHRYRDAGVIRPPRGAPLASRLLVLHERIAAAIDAHHPDLVAVESLFHARSPRTAITLGHARGVILLACAQRGIEVADYTPLEIKQSVTGRGDASKEQVHAMLCRLIAAPQDLAHDASDALAVALCHAHRVLDRVMP
ncbi:MAG: crossover junction endodeoxyribonuclease RuvC [Candidatus Eiseniibacteriota bacterium]